MTDEAPRRNLVPLRSIAVADQTNVLLRELVRGVAGLRAEVRELRAVVAPELAMRASVLRALRGAFGDSNFTAQDALEHAAEHPDGDCARALVPLLGGSPVGGLRRLSRRLAKLAGKPAAGLVLTRIGDDRGVALYVIQNG